MIRLKDLELTIMLLICNLEPNQKPLSPSNNHLQLANVSFQLEIKTFFRLVILPLKGAFGQADLILSLNGRCHHRNRFPGQKLLASLNTSWSRMAFVNCQYMLGFLFMGTNWKLCDWQHYLTAKQVHQLFTTLPMSTTALSYIENSQFPITWPQQRISFGSSDLHLFGKQ